MRGASGRDRAGGWSGGRSCEELGPGWLVLKVPLSSRFCLPGSFTDLPSGQVFLNLPWFFKVTLVTYVTYAH